MAITPFCYRLQVPGGRFSAQTSLLAKAWGRACCLRHLYWVRIGARSIPSSEKWPDTSSQKNATKSRLQFVLHHHHRFNRHDNTTPKSPSRHLPSPRPPQLDPSPLSRRFLHLPRNTAKMMRTSLLRATRAAAAPSARLAMVPRAAASTHAISNPTLANIEKRWEDMPSTEQAELWMALRDRMKENWADLTVQEKKAGT